MGALGATSEDRSCIHDRVCFCRRGTSRYNYQSMAALGAEFLPVPAEKHIEKQNESILKDNMFKELHTKINKFLPGLGYCLAPKKEVMKSGAAVLRAGAVVSDPGARATVSARSAEGLGKHSKALYDGVKLTCSRVRMLMTWQASGGLSYVAPVHHRGAQCFVNHGNLKHDGQGGEVSLREFHAAVKPATV